MRIVLQELHVRRPHGSSNSWCSSNPGAQYVGFVFGGTTDIVEYGSEHSNGLRVSSLRCHQIAIADINYILPFIYKIVSGHRTAFAHCAK